MLLEWERIWGYVHETSIEVTYKKDKAAYAKKLEIWNVSKSKILTWINNSSSQLIGVQLKKYDISKDVWDHLKYFYNLSNFGKTLSIRE